MDNVIMIVLQSKLTKKIVFNECETTFELSDY